MSNCFKIKQLSKVYQEITLDKIKKLDYLNSIPKHSFKTNYYLLNMLSNLNLERNERVDSLHKYLNENVSKLIDNKLGGRNLFNLFSCTI